MFKERGFFSQGDLKTYGGLAVKKGQFRALSIVTENFCWMLSSAEEDGVLRPR